jgi:Xaa-Pro dipeptidase
LKYVLHPKSEIDSRIKRLCDQMDEMDGAILFQSADLLYYSGTAQDGLVYLSRDGEATVLIRKSLERAIEESPLNVRRLKSLRSLKDDLGIASGSVIGLELDVLPYNNYIRLKKVLPDTDFIDISERIRHIRSVKSNFEIGLVRQAARIVDGGIGSVRDNLAEGMREIDLAIVVEAEMRRQGHQGLVRFRRFNQVLPLGHLMAGENAAHPSFVSSPTGGKGMSLLHPQGPGYRKIQRNEPVLVDFAGVYNGYTADETRIFSLGPLSRELEDAHLAALEIEDAIAEKLRPGEAAREIFAISEDLGRRRGYEDHLGGPPRAKCGFVGHGVGLEIDEYPVLGPVDHVIRPGMTVAVEPKMIYPGLGVVGIEDTFLTKDGTAERLTSLSREICRI